jgi:hypothetical protein
MFGFGFESKQVMTELMFVWPEQLIVGSGVVVWVTGEGRRPCAGAHE